MGASCCKSATDDGPEPVQESFGSSRKEFSRSPLKGHGSDAQFSAESTPRKIPEGSIGAPHDRFDRDTPNSNLAIESKSTTSEARSASSSTCSHDYCGPATEPICVSKLSTIHSASLSHPDRSPQSDASPLSHFPTGPSLSSPRVSPVLSTNPQDVINLIAQDSIGDVELPNDVFVRRNSAPADDSDAAAKISPRGPMEEDSPLRGGPVEDDDSAEVTAAFAFDSPAAGGSGITARNSYPVIGPASVSRPPDNGNTDTSPDFQVHLPHAPYPELLSDAAASRYLAASHSSLSGGSEYDTVGAAVEATDGAADAALGVDPSESHMSLYEEDDGEEQQMNIYTAGAALEVACLMARETTAAELGSPFVVDEQPTVEHGAAGPARALRRTVSGGVVTGIPASRGTGRAAPGRGRGSGALTAKERALRTAPEPFRAGGRGGMRQRGGRTGQGRKGGRSSFPMANSQFDTAGSRDDPIASVTSLPEPHTTRQPGRGRRLGGILDTASPSASAFSLPGYQGTNSLTDSQMAEMQAGSGFTPTASPSGHSPGHFFGAPQQFMPGAWGMMPGSPMMHGGGMMMPGSPGMMPGSPGMMPGSPGMMHGGGSMMAGGYSGMQQPGSARGGGTPTAASPSSVSSSRRGALSPELAALLGRDAAKGGHMQLSRQQHKMMRQQQRRMHSMGSMPMGFTGTPQAMAQLQMAQQQQQMALQMNPMNAHMMMSPQHSRSSSASSFSLNQPLRQGMQMRSGSGNHHSMSPHHSPSPQHMAMGGRHVSMGSSENSSGDHPAAAVGKGARAAPGARPATAGAVGRGAGRGAAAGRGRGAGPASSGMNQKSASYGGGLANAAQPRAAAYAQGGPMPGSMQRGNVGTVRR